MLPGGFGSFQELYVGRLEVPRKERDSKWVLSSLAGFPAIGLAIGMM